MNEDCYQLRQNCSKAEQGWAQVWLTGGEALFTWN